MNKFNSTGLRSLQLAACLALTLSLSSPQVEAVPVVAKPMVDTPVTITDQGGSWIMDNSSIMALILWGRAVFGSSLHLRR